MKILHIIPTLNYKDGGTTFAINNIIKVESLLNHKSFVLTYKKDDNFNGMDHNIIQMPPSFPIRYSRSKKALHYLKENLTKYDLFILHSSWGCLQIESALILAKYKRKYIIRPAGSLDPFDLKKKWLLKIILGSIIIKKVLKNSAGLFCTSDLEAERIITYGAEVRKYVLPLPHQISSQSNIEITFRQKYKLNEKDFIFLFLSRIDYKKGLNLLLPALKKVVNIYPFVKLVIAGSGAEKYEKKIKGIIDELDLGNNIIWTGFLSGDDKLNVFNSCDCFILPSMNENFGNSVVEALSHGMPVVISDNVYIWHSIIDKNAGWVCKYNVDSIYNVIKEIVTNKEDYEIKQKNTLSAAQQFSYKSLLPVYQRFYESLENRSLTK
ncbi:MAG: glycosyltransferase [Ignavibacteriaceae bacterium]